MLQAREFIFLSVSNYQKLSNTVNFEENLDDILTIKMVFKISIVENTDSIFFFKKKENLTKNTATAVTLNPKSFNFALLQHELDIVYYPVLLAAR